MSLNKKNILNELCEMPEHLRGISKEMLLIKYSKKLIDDLLKKKINYSPLKIGKITFFFQTIFIGMLLCNYANFFDIEILIKYFGLFIIYLTFISGIFYLIRWLKDLVVNL